MTCLNINYLHRIKNKGARHVIIGTVLHYWGGSIPSLASNCLTNSSPSGLYAGRTHGISCNICSMEGSTSKGIAINCRPSGKSFLRFIPWPRPVRVKFNSPVDRDTLQSMRILSRAMTCSSTSDQSYSLEPSVRFPSGWSRRGLSRHPGRRGACPTEKRQHNEPPLSLSLGYSGIVYRRNGDPRRSVARLQILH